MDAFRINRFPIFGVWGYVVAKRLGYSDDEAKSLAVARATLGAAAKAGNLGSGKKHGAPGHFPPTPRALGVVDYEKMAFMGMSPYVALTPEGEYRAVLTQKGMPQLIEPRKYTQSVQAKLGDHYQEVQTLLEQLADCFDPAVLGSQAYNLYFHHFAPMVVTESGTKRAPRFGERGEFDPATVEELIARERGGAS